MSAVRVSLDATAVPAKPGGAGRYVLNLAGELAARGTAGVGDVEMTVVCRQGDRARCCLLYTSPSPRD